MASNALNLAFAILTVVGGVLMLLGMGTIVHENRSFGSIALTLAMAAMFLVGVARLTGNLP